MQTSEWGPCLWNFGHTVSFNYPLEPSLAKKQQHKEYFYNIKNIMPCSFCRVSFAKFIQELPIDDFLDSRNGITYWFYLIHNKVNYKLGKTDAPTFREVVIKYESRRAKCKGYTSIDNKKIFGDCRNVLNPTINEEEVDKFVNETIEKYGEVEHNMNKHINIKNMNIKKCNLQDLSIIDKNIITYNVKYYGMLFIIIIVLYLICKYLYLHLKIKWI
jgi:hypothetical protein